MRMLGETAAGGDMAKLDEMFESGSLHTAKYLPLVLKKMKEESDKMMGEYWGTLPYYTAEAARQQELWMRSFAEHGGESGLNSFWESWAQIIEQSRGTAEVFGRYFERVSKDFSGLILLPQEFVRWTQGETDERNLFQSLFGDAPVDELNYHLNQFKEELSHIPGLLKSFGEASQQVVDLIGRITKPFGDISTKVTSADAHAAGVEQVGVMEWATQGFSGLAKWLRGDKEGGGEELYSWRQHKHIATANLHARRSAEDIMTRRYGEDKEDWPKDVLKEVIQTETERFTSPAALKDIADREKFKYFPFGRTLYRNTRDRELEDFSNVKYPFTTVGVDDPLHFNLPGNLQGLGNAGNLNPTIASLESLIRSTAARNSNAPSNIYSPVFSNSSLGGGQHITVKHEIFVDAKVEARTDSEAISNEIVTSLEGFMQDANRTIPLVGR